MVNTSEIALVYLKGLVIDGQLIPILGLIIFIACLVSTGYALW